MRSALSGYFRCGNAIEITISVRKQTIALADGRSTNEVGDTSKSKIIPHDCPLRKLPQASIGQFLEPSATNLT